MSDEARLGPVEQVPVGEGRAFRVGEAQVAVFRTRAGGLHALAAVCPHLGGPLADGLVDADVVMCPLHNHQFSLRDGSCATGADDVATYPVREEDGELLVDDRTVARTPQAADTAGSDVRLDQP